MRFWMLALVACGSTGCTMMSLERHTVAQTDSVTDLRYHEVMDNLAMIANDPSTLPSYSSIFSGTAFVQDDGQFVSTSILPYHKVMSAGSMAVNTSLNRQISENWTLDPIMSPEKLEAIRAACQWAIGGPGAISKDSISLLIRPEDSPRGPDRHFGVVDRLGQMPNGWLCRGEFKDVPLCANYKAHCGNTWVWVNPDGMKGLVDLTLAIQRIARVPINSPTLFNFAPVYTPIVFETADTAGKANPGGRIKVTAQVVVDQSGHLQTDSPWFPVRVDSVGSDAALRSAIGAAGIAAVPH